MARARSSSKAIARTRLSSKGQVIIPKAVREAHGWQPGVELEVEDQGDAVVLRPANPFPPTTIEEVYGCLKHDGPPISIEEMHEGIEREARRMWEEFERQRK
jgi:AbrB family looped-hinge helix DNA binding protein